MRISLFSICLVLVSSLLFGQNSIVKTGIEVLRDSNFKILEGKKVGLVTNVTGVDRNLKSTIDILYEAKNVNLVALYAPEHGIRGDFLAGDNVENSVDPLTNLPVYSLHGATRKPTPDMLKDIDVFVYDLQDIGCRSYTFISSMGLLMEAAAENNKEVIILDRPNPLGGIRVEGNLVKEGFISFVSQFPIPYVYGLTCGELANFLNDEGILKNKVKCKLTVIKMEGWQRDMTFEETGLEWVPTSQHVPHKHSAFYYVTSGILGELGNVSIGVGYTLPFQTFAIDSIDCYKLTDLMNSYNLEGVIFRPITYKPYYATFKDKKISGVQTHILDYHKVNLMEIQFYFLQAFHELYPNREIFNKVSNRFNMFDKVSGTDEIRNIFTKNFKFDEIKDIVNSGVEEFKENSKKYHLYK